METEVECLRRENEELRSAKGMLDAMLRATPGFVIRCNRDFQIEFVNRVRPEFRIEDVVGASALDFVPPDYREAAEKALKAALRGESTQFSSATLINHEVFLYETRVAPVVEDGIISGLCLLALDVTGDRQRSEALRVVDDKLRVAVDATGIGLWTWDAVQGVVWDARMREITGHDTPLDQAEWEQKLAHPADREVVAAAMQLADQGTFSGATHRIVRPDGEIRWVLPAGRVVTDDKGAPVSMSGGVLDITRLRQLEEQMVQVQKLEAVGSLTAGVAHNFNNLLMAILPTLELLEPVVPISHRQYLVDATHAAERGAELVRELMTFAGQRGRAPRTRLQPSAIVEQAVKMCRRTFGSHIVVVVRYDDELPDMLCDSGAIEHVLVNLLLNARDALGSSGGKIQLDVRRAEGDEAKELQGSCALCIEVRDEGEGITDELRPKIFEPFVSSKGPNGTGLGLSTAYTVVAEHGGTIGVDSVVGQGTTFRIYLPGVSATDLPVAPAPRKHILVVDDETPVRRVVRRILEDSDYLVSEAADVEEATRALNESTPDLLLLDRSLAGRNGRELVPIARAQCPGAKILYFSGHHVPPDEQDEVDGVLQKPVGAKTLVEAIERSLRDVD